MVINVTVMSDLPDTPRTNTRRNNVKVRRKPRKTVVMLISCCLFLLIVCSCLLAALVLIGKHFVYNPIGNSKTPLKSDVPSARRSIFRLPKDTLPLKYDVTLLPDLETGTFKGKVNVTLEIASARSNIVLHSKNLSIETVELTFVNDSLAILVQNVEANEADETIAIVPKTHLKPGIYTLALKYSGSLVGKLAGFYKSTYRSKGSNNRTR